MKKYIFIIIFIISNSLYLYAGGYNVCIDGIWGTWNQPYGFYVSWPENEMLFYDEHLHPSQYFLKVTLFSYYTPSKEEKKRRRKNNEWYEFKGEVEYFLNKRSDLNDNWNDRWRGFPLYRDILYKEKEDCIPNKMDAKILIAPYKDTPHVVNIFFSNIGIAMQFDSPE
jgi:hypothetical protein